MLSCSGCAGWLPDSGPNRTRVSDIRQDSNAANIQVIDVNSAVAQQLAASEQQNLFSEVFKAPTSFTDTVGAGDEVSISIWEAPPAALFGSATTSGSGSSDSASSSMPATSHSTDIPDQVVSSDGTLEFPFVGRITVAGMSPAQIEDLIGKKLEHKAHLAQVLVRVVHNSTANVTVVGEVSTSLRMPFTPKREHLLDALAAAGGSKSPNNKLSVQLTRGNVVATLPLETIIRDPRQDIELRPDDIVTVLFQPFSFTVLGATGKNDEIDFEAKGISLAQALARSGGLNDSRANPRAVFIFRFESDCALDWPSPHFTEPNGKVPVVYRVDMSDPSTFFVAQNFHIKDKDVIYVSNAPATELEKFLGIISPITVPAINGAAVKSGV